MVTFFSILAIIISCLGLFGLATFMTEQKRKEIAVRRVNGAEIKDIVWILNMQFLKPVAIAFVLAVPVAICLLNSWLSGYTHRTELNLWVFLLSGGITILIASLTLFWRTWAAANENPVIALKE